MDCNPGKRIIFNDRKTKFPGIDTAEAHSIPRNGNIQIDEQDKNFGFSIIENLTSGSGAETFRLNLHQEVVVRKSVQVRTDNRKLLDVLQLQAQWFKIMNPIVPSRIPRLLSCEERGGMLYMDVEEISDSRKFSEILLSHEVSESGLTVLIGDLITSLTTLYTATSEPTLNSDSFASEQILKTINERAIPGIESLFGMPELKEFRLLHSKKIQINGQPYGNPISTLASVAEKAQNLRIRGFGSRFQTLIHGDLTFENLIVRGGSVYFIDPLGASMDLTIPENLLSGASKSSPAFDYVKLMQSLYAGYESWNEAPLISRIDGSGISINRGYQKIASKKTLQQVNDFFAQWDVDTSESNMKFCLALLLFRIIPYKLPANLNKALYCFALGTILLEESNDILL
jgi:hypothetical protein